MPRPLRGRRRGKEGEGGDLTAHFGGDILRVDGLARAVGVVEKTADHVVLDVVVNVPAQAHARVDTAIHHATRPDVRVVAACRHAHIWDSMHAYRTRRHPVATSDPSVRVERART